MDNSKNKDKRANNIVLDTSSKILLRYCRIVVHRNRVRKS